MSASVVIIICAIAAMAALILLRYDLLVGQRKIAIASVCLILAFVLRIFSLSHETLDYINFLSKWVDYFREAGGFAGLGGEVGNYNIPYLYFLALFSYSSIPDLYLIKLLSIFFDVVLAWGVMKLVGHFCGKTKMLAAFLLTLLLPTVILNGAYWGQCDSIYVSLAVWGIYFAISGRPVRSMVAIALSFAFKLQAIFIMPVFFILLFTQRIKLQHLLVFPITYIVVITPAVALGRPLLETLTLYFNQAGSVGSGLNYNSPSVFSLLRVSGNESMWATIGISAAFLFIFLLFAWHWRRTAAVTDEVVVFVSLAFAIGVPFFLPHMHDRYFFAADILSLAVAVMLPRLTPLPLLVSFASLLGYHAYLKMQFLLPMSFGAVALILALLILLFELFQALNLRQQYRR